MRRGTAVLSALTLVLAGVAAAAFPTAITTTVYPVRIDACQAFTQKLFRTNTGRIVAPGHKGLLEHYVAPVWMTHLGVAFTNTGRRALHAVGIAYVVLDSSGQPRGAHEAVWRGRFDPGRRYEFNSAGFEIVRLIHVPVSTIECRVSRAEIAR